MRSERTEPECWPAPRMRAPSSVHPTLSDNTPTEGADVACRHATHSEREPSMQIRVCRDSHPVQTRGDMTECADVGSVVWLLGSHPVFAPSVPQLGSRPVTIPARVGCCSSEQVHRNDHLRDLGGGSCRLRGGLGAHPLRRLRHHRLAWGRSTRACADPTQPARGVNESMKSSGKRRAAGSSTALARDSIELDGGRPALGAATTEAAPTRPEHE